jgi:4-carboxymuconolactone decarboxylase
MAAPSEFNQKFRQDYPKVWEAFSALATECHSAGPLDDKTRRLVKLALAVGAGLEGATHSAVRHAADAGTSKDEMLHIAVLGITTLGFPSAMRAASWILDDQAAEHGRE